MRRKPVTVAVADGFVVAFLDSDGAWDRYNPADLGLGKGNTERRGPDKYGGGYGG